MSAPYIHSNPVSFLDAIKLGFVGYVKWNGRATRTEYWFWVLFTSILGMVLQGVNFVLAVLISVASSSSEASSTLLSVLSLGLSGLFSLVYLAVALPSISVLIRRLHDTGRSAWWATGLYVFAFVLVSFWIIAGIFAVMAGMSGSGDFTWGTLLLVSLTLGGLALLGWSVTVLVFTLLPSTPQATRWDGGFRPAGPLCAAPPSSYYSTSPSA